MFHLSLTTVKLKYAGFQYIFMVRIRQFPEQKFIGFRTTLGFKKNVEDYAKKKGYPSLSDFMRILIEKELK